MSSCPACHHEVIQALLGDQTTVLLEPSPRTFVAVDEHSIFPTDGARVFQSAALVEHAVLCPAQRRIQAEERTVGKQQYEQRQRTKKGV
jgi:hypothetical protein